MCLSNMDSVTFFFCLGLLPLGVAKRNHLPPSNLILHILQVLIKHPRVILDFMELLFSLPLVLFLVASISASFYKYSHCPFSKHLKLLSPKRLPLAVPPMDLFQILYKPHHSQREFQHFHFCCLHQLLSLNQ